MKYKAKLKTTIIMAVATMLPFGVALPGFAAESIPADSRSLVIGSSDSQWSNKGDHSIVLDKGGVVVVAGSEPFKVETKVGTVEISPNLEAVIQQDNTLPVTVTAVACRRAVDENSPDCALTVATNDDSTYKVAPGKQLKLSVGGSLTEVTDVVMLRQQPEVAMSVSNAAHDLVAAAFALTGNPNDANSQTVTACAKTLMVGSVEGPVKLYITEGANLVALQPGTQPLIASSADAKPKPKAMEAQSSGTDEAAVEEHLLSKLEILGGTQRSASLNAGH